MGTFAMGALLQLYAASGARGANAQAVTRRGEPAVALEEHFDYRVLRTGPSEIVPITVEVTPGFAVAVQGTAYTFTANVRNSSDRGVEWSVTPSGYAMQLLGDGSQGRVQTSDDPGLFPVTVRATSTATGGLRDKPDRPEINARFRDASCGSPNTYAFRATLAAHHHQKR